MGEKARIRVLFAATLAAFLFLGWLANSFILLELPARTIDELHGLLTWALRAVIIGVVIEELPLLWKVWKFARFSWSGKVKEALQKAWLHKKEIVEGVGFTILVVGLAGELELDPIIETRQRAADMEKAGEIQRANTSAAAANIKAANLLAENVELERALAPRIIDSVTLAQAVQVLPRVPLFFSALNREEPREVAGFIRFAFAGISIGKSDTWQTENLPSVEWNHQGISLLYLDYMNGGETDAKRVAIAICEQLKTQGLETNTTPVLVPDLPPGMPARPNPMWPNGLPLNAVLISVGVKANHFWENKMFREKGFPELHLNNFCTSDEAFASFKADSEKRRLERDQQSPSPSPPRVSP